MGGICGGLWVIDLANLNHFVNIGLNNIIGEQDNPALLSISFGDYSEGVEVGW